MSRNHQHSTHSATVIAVLACIGLATPSAVLAQNVAPSYKASPDVYKLLAENDQFRVFLATWKPGQRDEFHSHPANATYALTACNTRIYGPDNQVQRETQRAPGSVVLQAPIASHSFENAGPSDCQILIVERK